jgi:hypothetical protein
MVGRQLLKVYKQLLVNGEQEWSLTESQKERLGVHLETEYKTLIELLGENFHSTIVRMAVQIERIAMILTAFRLCEEPLQHFDLDSQIYCNEEDFMTAEMIGSKLLLHMAVAYRMIDGDVQNLVPEVKLVDQRKVLFEQLDDIFDRKGLILEAKAQGVSERTAERWNTKWQEEGVVVKIEHGKYKKVG